MKDPAVLFYTQDFITGTLLMTYEQKGKYITLLCLQQQNGKLTEKDLLKVCGAKDDDIWAKFELHNDGFYYNGRMLTETEKRKKYNESRRRNLHMDAHMEICNKKYEDEIRIKNKEIEFKSEVFEFLEKYSKEMLNKFCNYWTEKNKSRTKMRFELEKTFEISRRLATWASRDKDMPKTDPPLTYNEMLEGAKDDPDFWKGYKAVKRPGDSKPLFYPIET